MKNLNFLTLALAFAITAQSCALMATEEVKPNNFFKNHQTALIASSAGVAGLGLGFLAGSKFTTAKMMKKRPSLVSSKNAIIAGVSAAAIAGIVLAVVKRAAISDAFKGGWKKLTGLFKKNASQKTEFNSGYAIEPVVRVFKPVDCFTNNFEPKDNDTIIEDKDGNLSVDDTTSAEKFDIESEKEYVTYDAENTK